MKDSIKILFVEDVPRDAELNWRELEKGGIVFKKLLVDNRKDFLEGLESFKPDIILSDYSLPQFDGMQALLLRNELVPQTPFIIVTGSVNEEVAVECMKAGADDYVIKEHLTRLPFAIIEALEQNTILIEKKAAELLLKENEEKLQSIFSAAPVGIGLVVGRVFIEVNDTFCKMTGYTRTELTGKNAETIYAKDEQNESAGIVIYRHIADKGTGSVETRFKCKDGRILNIFLSSTPLDKNDLTKGVTFIAMDITEKKRAEEALSESRQLFQTLAQMSPDGIFRTNSDGYTTYLNPKYLELTGLSVEEALGFGWINAVHPDDMEILKGNWLSDIKSQKTSYAEYRFVKPDKSIVWVIGKAVPELIGNEVAGYIGTITDITDRKKAEDKLRSSEERFKILFDYAPDAYYLNDLKGYFIDGNIACEKLMGYKKNELVGKSFLKLNLLSLKQLPGAAKLLIKNSLGQATGPDEFELRRKDESKVTVEILTHPVKIYDQTLVLALARDITERKQAEEELIKAKDKAEEGDRLKTAFLHNISHEIRTPMNAIVGFSALLGEPDADAQSRKDYIEVITQSSNHLLAIISDIVDISNIEANLVKNVKNEININSTLQSLCNQFMPKANEKKIELVCETMLSDTDALVLIDSTKLNQILINLINNAIKFTIKGYVKVGCVLTDKFLEFNVSDTGIGISAEYHAKIFDRFYQVQHSLSKLYEGTGLGLAISKAHVELMGGKIWLTSEPGKGASFYFTIPYEKQSVKTLATNEREVAEGFVFPVKKTILVAEDMDSNFKLIKYFLSNVNTNLIRASNGKEAVDKYLSNKNIDLILMDIKMPVMDGYTAVKLIREINSTIPIIAQTAYIDDREQAIEFGCSGFISKPFDKKGLLQIIREFI